CSTTYTFIVISYLPHTIHRILIIFLFFFNDTSTTYIYTLSLHDALPISNQIIMIPSAISKMVGHLMSQSMRYTQMSYELKIQLRSEEHTSELQSHLNLVCRLLLEKKKKEKILKIL